MINKRKKIKAGQDGEDAFSRIVDAAPGDNKERGGKKSRSGKKTALLVLIILLSLALLVLGGMGVAGYMLTAADTNFPNVYIDGIDAGGLTQAQTVELLEARGWDERVGGELKVSIPGDVSFTLDFVSAGAQHSANQAAEAAYSYGRGSNILENLFVYIKSCLVPVDVDMYEKALNEDYIRSSMADGIERMSKATAKVGYETDMEKAQLRMIKGAGQIKLDETLLYSAITQALKEGKAELEFDTLAQTITAPDFARLYADIAVEMQNASFDENFEIIPEVVGISFDVEAAKTLWVEAAPGEEIVIPLIITQPEINSEALQSMLFRDVLGSQTTYYTWSTAERIGNIHLAASKIDGLILMPGDVFSFNETVGQRTEEAGFRSASAYNDGQVVEAIGGGICQVSSTLYCAQMYAQLKTSYRVNHYFKVDYLDYGLDATVSWKNPDYKFTNSRDYPVKIAAYCDDDSGALTIEIWGTDVDGSYVQLRHTSEPVYDEEWTETLIGYSVRGYRDIYDADGNWIDTRSEPGGVYYFHEEDIQWPAEKLKQEKELLEGALDVLEELENENAEDEEEGYLFDPDEYLGGYDIYA